MMAMTEISVDALKRKKVHTNVFPLVFAFFLNSVTSLKSIGGKFMFSRASKYSSTLLKNCSGKKLFPAKSVSKGFVRSFLCGPGKLYALAKHMKSTTANIHIDSWVSFLNTKGRKKHAIYSKYTRGKEGSSSRGLVVWKFWKSNKIRCGGWGNLQHGCTNPRWIW